MVFPGKNDCFISRLTYPGTGTFSLLATSAKVFERLLTMMNTEARQQKSNWDGACLESLSKTVILCDGLILSRLLLCLIISINA